MILLDMDETIVSCLTGLEAYFGKPYTGDQYAVHEFYSNKTREMFWRSLPEWFWAELDPMPYMQELLDLIGDDFMVYTMARHENIAHGKIAWLKRHLPEAYDQGRYLIGGGHKERLAKGNLLIDDNELYCEEFVKYGGRAILVPAQYNSLAGKDQMIEIRRQYE